jgi:hypothetical protein
MSALDFSARRGASRAAFAHSLIISQSVFVQQIAQQNVQQADMRLILDRNKVIGSPAKVQYWVLHSERFTRSNAFMDIFSDIS